MEPFMASNEAALAEQVGRWAAGVAPGHHRGAEVAAAAAVQCLRAGGTVREACDRARAVLSSWLRHPANQSAVGATVGLALAAAS